MAVGCGITPENVYKLQVGTTTQAQVDDSFGSPKAMEAVVEGSDKINVDYFGSVNVVEIGPVFFGGYSRLAVEVRNGIVDGYLFYRSDGAEATHFDARKANQIIDGQTTRGEAIAILGRPNGISLLPSRISEYGDLATNNATEVLNWSNADPIGGLFAPGHPHVRMLTLQIGPDERVISKSFVELIVNE